MWHRTMWVRIPPGAWMFVCCECFVLSGRGLCDELITRPEEFYRLWCFVVYDLETSRMRKPRPTEGCHVKNKNKNTHSWINYTYQGQLFLCELLATIPHWRVRLHTIVPCNTFHFFFILCNQSHSQICFRELQSWSQSVYSLLTYSMKQSPSWEANQ